MCRSRMRYSPRGGGSGVHARDGRARGRAGGGSGGDEWPAARVPQADCWAGDRAGEQQSRAYRRKQSRRCDDNRQACASAARKSPRPSRAYPRPDANLRPAGMQVGRCARLARSSAAGAARRRIPGRRANTPEGFAPACRRSTQSSKASIKSSGSMLFRLRRKLASAPTSSVSMARNWSDLIALALRLMLLCRIL